MPMQVVFEKTEIDAVQVVMTGVVRDERGSFSESYSRRMWREAGFHEVFVQDNLSRSCKGTLRGMHYQLNPHGMGKLVRVVHGAAFDVAVDLRSGSPSFGRWVGRHLSAENALSLWIPVGFAHGFLSLEDDTLVHYKCTSMHTPEAERSLHHADPKMGIEWPIEPSVVSAKDLAAPVLEQAEINFRYDG